MIPIPPWLTLRVATMGLAAIGVVLLVTALLLTRASLRAAEAELSALQARHDSVTEQLQSARTSSNSWQTVALQAQLELNQRIERDRIQRERDAAAVEEARLRAAEANATLRGWLERYEAATRDAECAAQLAEPICAN